MLKIKVRKEYLNKDVCLDEARQIISDGRIKNMNELQLAREIYFHALAFYFCERFGIKGWMKVHADPINLHDGGDTLLRRAVFASSWMLTGRKK